MSKNAKALQGLAHKGGSELFGTHKQAGLALMALGDGVRALAERSRSFDTDLARVITGEGTGESLIAVARKAAPKPRKRTRKAPAKKTKTAPKRRKRTAAKTVKRSHAKKHAKPKRRKRTRKAKP